MKKKTTPPEKPDYHWETVRRHVCEQCADYPSVKPNSKTECGHCALSRDFPKVREMLESIVGTGESDLEYALKKHICNDCRNQDHRGRCVLRNNQDCALQVNLPTIVAVFRSEQELSGKKA